MLGRGPERAAIDELLLASGAGRGGALVLLGDLGVGLTTLLRHAASAATDRRVVWTSGVEAERHLAFAGVHAFCVSMLDRLGEIPAPQREALSSVLGLAEKGIPDPFLVGLAVLALLTKAADERPLFSRSTTLSGWTKSPRTSSRSRHGGCTASGWPWSLRCTSQ